MHTQMYVALLYTARQELSRSHQSKSNHSRVGRPDRILQTKRGCPGGDDNQEVHAYLHSFRCCCMVSVEYGAVVDSSWDNKQLLGREEGGLETSAKGCWEREGERWRPIFAKSNMLPYLCSAFVSHVFFPQEPDWYTCLRRVWKSENLAYRS